MLRQKWSRGQIEARLVNLTPYLVGMEACVGAHHLARKLAAFGHDTRLMPASTAGGANIIALPDVANQHLSQVSADRFTLEKEFEGWVVDDRKVGH